ncbi:MAG: phosphotransferase [Bacteroidales bacterium]|nr:phosphotransferase [Bacteroidales bacterium]MBK7627514.1 phosphotransferase [Bacteroidales bacterium]
MSELEIVSDRYKEIFGNKDFKISALPQSGSDRKYFRITGGGKSVIGAYNANPEENEAFIGFTKHFQTIGLPVPEIYGYIPEKYTYFLRDLGDSNLFTWLQSRDFNFDAEAVEIYRKTLDKLILFQIDGMKGLNLDLCYPHKSFDRQSMMWDMNYFKYMFLKLVAVPFNERRLEHDFNTLADFLLETGQDYFLYRDFQSANVMIVNGEPWFIDYQGGRKGAPQYDVASLLYDAKAHIPSKVRQDLLEYHIDNFCAVSGEKREEFTGYFTGFSMIRLMQALGAFGFRGLYEKKPTFTGSIVPAVKLLNELIDSNNLPVELSELFQTVRLIPEQKIYKELEGL